MARKPKKLYLHLLPGFVAVAFLALGIVALGSYGFLDRLLLEEQKENLETQTKVLSTEFRYLLSRGKDRMVDERCEELGRATGDRYTVILADGQVVGDSDVGVAEMGNHLERPEVREALNGELAVDIRESQSTEQKYLFVAVPLDGGKSKAVLRIAKPFDSMKAIVKTVYFRFLIGIVLTLGVALLFSLGFARRLTRPLERIVSFLWHVRDDETLPGDIDDTGFSQEYVDLKEAVLSVVFRLKGAIGRLREKGSDLETRTRELDRLAHYDPLTGLPNRAMLYPAIEEAMMRAAGEGRELALLFFDLDHFKEVNDSFGHETGDLLLQAMAERLKAGFQQRAMVARLGGDEFCALVENFGDREEVASLAEELREDMKCPFEIRDHVLDMSISIGISLFPSDGETRKDLLHAADMAMYSVKRGGRDDFAFYRPEEVPSGEGIF